MTAPHYRITKKVAKGGSGTVYRATLSDGRVVAVKRFSASYARAAFARESELLADLDHPNIVKFYGIKRLQSGELDLIMEWVGPTLQRLLAAGPLEPAVAVQVIHGLLKALEHLHAHKQQHRDLSPRNVLLGSDGSVKLVDFGLSKPANAPRHTEGLRGSPPYISPEQIHDVGLDARSDLFPVGVLFYELLTGTPPYSSSTEIAKNTPITPLSVLRPELPEEFERCILKFLAYDRRERYASARAAIDGLMALPWEFLGRAPLQRQMRDRGLMSGASSARPRQALMVAAGLAVGLTLGFAGTSLYDGTPWPATTSEKVSTVPVPAKPLEAEATKDVHDRAQHVIDNTDSPAPKAREKRAPTQRGKSVNRKKNANTATESQGIMSSEKDRPESPGGSDVSLEMPGGSLVDESALRGDSK